MSTKLFLSLIAACCFWAIAQTTFAQATGEPWWATETVTATGNGFSPSGVDNPNRKEMLAKHAAKIDAYRKLAEKASGIHITATDKVAKGEIDAIINGAKIVSEKYDELSGCYTVVMEVPLYGVSNSISSVAFKESQKKIIADSQASNLTNGEYTGLIVDCSDLTDADKNTLNPVLAPKIKSSDDKEVYSSDDVSYNELVEKGMVSYADREHANKSRAGDRPLIVKAAGLTDNNTTPILTPLDRDKVMQANLNSHFLNKGAVVLVGFRVAAESDNDSFV